MTVQLPIEPLLIRNITTQELTGFVREMLITFDRHFEYAGFKIIS